MKPAKHIIKMANREPNGNQNALQSRASDRVSKNIAPGDHHPGTFGSVLGAFFYHFPSKVDKMSSQKTFENQCRKIRTIDAKSLQNHAKIDAQSR